MAILTIYSKFGTYYILNYQFATLVDTDTTVVQYMIPKWFHNLLHIFCTRQGVSMGKVMVDGGMCLIG